MDGSAARFGGRKTSHARAKGVALQVCSPIAAYTPTVFDAALGFLGELFGGYTGAGSVPDDERALAAYEAAWNHRQDVEPLSYEPLIKGLKSHNVPGVYTGPEHRAELAAYFDGWRDGRTPDSIREMKRHARRTQRGRRRELWSRAYVVGVLLVILIGIFALAAINPDDPDGCEQSNSGICAP